jgi:putative FmdB family regulatory protein
MPTYAYKCDCGTEQEQFFRIADKPDTVPCECGGRARKILSAGMVLGDDMPKWMRHKETLGCLQSSGDKQRITTRSEYNRYLKSRNIAEISANREI